MDLNPVTLLQPGPNIFTLKTKIHAENETTKHHFPLNSYSFNELPWSSHPQVRQSFFRAFMFSITVPFSPPSLILLTRSCKTSSVGVKLRVVVSSSLPSNRSQTEQSHWKAIISVSQRLCDRWNDWVWIQTVQKVIKTQSVVKVTEGVHEVNEIGKQSRKTDMLDFLFDKMQMRQVVDCGIIRSETERLVLSFRCDRL